MAANSAKNSQVKRRGPGRPFPKGTSGNPKGGPKRGESWAETIKAIVSMSGPDLAKIGGPYAPLLKKLPAGTPVRDQVVIASVVSLLNDPDPRLLIALMDRAEGKVAQPIAVTWREELEKRGVPASDIFERMVAVATAELARANGGGGDDGGSAPAASTAPPPDTTSGAS